MTKQASPAVAVAVAVADSQGEQMSVPGQWQNVTVDKP